MSSEKKDNLNVIGQSVHSLEGCILLLGTLDCRAFWFVFVCFPMEKDSFKQNLIHYTVLSFLPYFSIQPTFTTK